MGNYIFKREEEENKIQKRAILDKNKKKLMNIIVCGLLIVGSFIGVCLTGGTILLIDGGITLSYIITNIAIRVYDKIVEKYIKYIPIAKKRDFRLEINKFYKNAFDGIINENDGNPFKAFINQFIFEENILEKTSNRFDQKRNKMINDSNKLKNKFNILVIGPTGAGKSTLINEFFNIKDAVESYGDVGTYGFRPYTTNNSEYTLYDSQGLDYSKDIDEYAEFLKDKILELNKHPNSFIDMIYYCTNNNTRLLPEEINLIRVLEKIYDLERVPLIIVHTQAISEHFHLQFENFVKNKYEGKYPIVKILARDLDDKKAEGMEELKNITKQKKENIFENSYYCKFIANVSQNLYKNYSDNIFITKLKGIINTSKEDSIEDIFIKLFNMYRFEEKGKSFNNEQKSKLDEFNKKLINNYKKNIDNFIRIVIKYNAVSDAYYELKNRRIWENQMEDRIDELKIEKSKEFDDFKKEIDTLLFPCFVDILKTKIISYFNQRIMQHLKPKIDELMAH